MVGVFGRSISFTNKTSTPQPKKPSRHIRSASLPCYVRSHPLIKDEIDGLKAWSSEFGSSKTRTSTRLLNGLTRLRTLHDSLHDFLQVHYSGHARLDELVLEKVLADILKYVDAYGKFKESLMALKAAQQAAFLKMRKISQQLHLYGSYELAAKKLNKEMSKLVSSVCCINDGVVLTRDEDDEIESTIRDVCDVTAMVSIILFTRVMINNTGTGKKWPKMMMTLLKPWRIGDHGETDHVGSVIEEFKLGVCWSRERMVEVEEVMDGIEMGSERVFRGLINTRVLLLNLLTQ